MKISRWKMISGLTEELFGSFTFLFMLACGIGLLYTQHFSTRIIIFVSFAEGFMIFLYAINNAFGFVTDIILKNIGETDWISEENIKYIAVLPGLCHRTLGCEIKVFEEGKKPKTLKIYKKMAFWPEGPISRYKIYYLKTCRAVVGWEVVKYKKKINFSRKPRKSK